MTSGNPFYCPSDVLVLESFLTSHHFGQTTGEDPQGHVLVLEGNPHPLPGPLIDDARAHEQLIARQPFLHWGLNKTHQLTDQVFGNSHALGNTVEDSRPTAQCRPTLTVVFSLSLF